MNLVPSSWVREARLLRRKLPYERLDWLILAIIYALSVSLFASHWEPMPEFPDYPDPELVEEMEANGTADELPDLPIPQEIVLSHLLGNVGFYAVVAAVLVHVFSLLGCVWSVRLTAALRFAPVSVERLRSATHVLMIPTANHGSAEICTLQRSSQTVRFTYQQRLWLYSTEKNSFGKLDFPTHQKFSDYTSSKGLTAIDALTNQRKYGPNHFNIPLPAFGEMFREQALAPFFVFQVFCVLLWCLDEYWQYSIFTLVMLLVFEAAVVKSRQRNLQLLRQMSTRERKIMALRNGVWKVVKTTELVPGDLVSVSFSADDDQLNTVPCDVLLLRGKCVVNEAMLTGETTPQMKESPDQRETDEVLGSLKGEDKVHVLFGGTQIVQTAAGSTADQNSNRLPQPRDGGCVGYVLRTGFETSQGKLVRTILFSTERATANTLESFMFILFLLIFALIASGYVLYHGLADETRSRYRLLLSCTLIITSVIPPELPMELSLAVNNSLVALQKLSVFCTEPFRIPFAGKVDVCCFDKTGTLTSERLHLVGFAGVTPLPNVSNETETKKGPPKAISSEESSTLERAHEDIHVIGRLPEDGLLAIGGCHSLMLMNGEMLGDPMELEALERSKWKLSSDTTVVRETRKGAKLSLSIAHRFHFSSKLKRMTTLVNTNRGGKQQTMVLMKGAPEMVQTFLRSAPADFERQYKGLARKGFRVIALATRRLSQPINKAMRMGRADLESNMQFAGLIAFTCPIKSHSKPTIERLVNSSHTVVMITGDNELTACHVASAVSMANKTCAVLRSERGVWETVDESETIAFDTNGADVHSLCEKWDLCVTGPGLDFLHERGKLDEYVESIKVWARVAPEQKELIIRRLGACGRVTLMCGDGTNDVGALKQSHVGVALLQPVRNTGQLAKQGHPQAATLLEQEKKRREAQQKRRRPRTIAESLEQLQEDESESTLVKLGDASVASPFTAKAVHIQPVIDILRQGRCTLVTTLQMYKILALNCLVNAFQLSVLYLEGVKLGDTQATIAGLLIAMCFLFISGSKPLSRLSSERPRPNIFNLYVILSVLGQALVHLGALIMAMRLAETNSLRNETEREPDGKFSPTLVNTSVFLVSCGMQVSSFVINYKGHPFMQSLRENKKLFNALAAVFLFVIVGTAELSRDLNDYMELVPFPSEDFKNTMLGIVIGDFAIAFAVERVAAFLFPLKSRAAA